MDFYCLIVVAKKQDSSSEFLKNSTPGVVYQEGCFLKNSLNLIFVFYLYASILKTRNEMSMIGIRMQSYG